MSFDLTTETKRLLKQYALKPRKRLGQNFIVDLELLEEILEVAKVSRTARVLEVGGGLGTLTRKLAAQAAQVDVVDVDPTLSRLLHEELASLKNVRVIKGDILEMTLPEDETIVSNVPYSISSPLLLKILQSSAWQRAILTLQKDFAARLVAETGSRDYGRLTLAAYYYADVRLRGSYSPQSFFPPPVVYSQIVELNRRRKPPIRMDRPELFWELSRVLFTQRNRLLSKALKTLAKGDTLPKVWAQALAEEAPERLLLRRVRELDPADFAALADLVSSTAGVDLG